MPENRAEGAAHAMPDILDGPTSPTGRSSRSRPRVDSPGKPSDPADRLGLFDALSPLVTVIGATDVGEDDVAQGADGDPFQALVADIAIQRSREESTPNGEHRRALLRAVAELAETHAVAADLACEETAIDLPLDVPDPADARSVAGDVEGAPTKPMLIVPDMIRTCRDRLAAHMSDADRSRIDIVASLFDQVIADTRLTTGVRNTLARLQLPVLRIALADESFFQSRTHPTRRLLDRLAAAAAEWQGDSPSARAGLVALERIVHRVIRGSFEDAGEHALMLEQFERAIVDIATAASATPAEPVPDSEDRDVLVIRTTIQLSQLLAGVEVDRTVRFFMLDVWSRVIVEIACRPADAARDALLARAKRLCFDMAWAAAPKTTSGERARLAGLLPTMIEAIRDGLRVIDYPAEEERKFFSEWTRVLIQAVRGAPGSLFRASDIGIEGLTIDAFARRLREGSFGPETAIGAGSSVAPQGRQADPGAAPSTRPDPGPNASGPAEPAPPQPPIEPAKLEKGQWFDLRNGDVFNRVRLSWISPLRSFFLFIGADSAVTRSLDPGTISSLVARGDLKRATKRKSD